MQKTLIFMTVAVLLVFTISACNNDDMNKPESTIKESTLDNSSSTEAGESEKKEVISAEGKYTGRIDNSSIEIMVDGKPGDFRFDEKLKSEIEKLSSDDTVSIEYYENEKGQLILEKLEAVVEDNDMQGHMKYLDVTGVYVGQIDGHSIEIIIDSGFDIEGSGSSRAFSLLYKDSMDYFDNSSESFLELDGNEKVKFSFFINEHGQYVLTKLSKE